MLAVMCSWGTAAADDKLGRGLWTAQDWNAIVDAAAAAASTAPDRAQQASLLLDLADALVKAGAESRARSFAQQAAAVLTPSDLAGNTFVRDHAIETLAQLGDVQNARALIDLVVTPQDRVALLGKLGAARAHYGDIAAAEQIAAAIRSLPNPARSPNSGLPGVPAFATATIALALADAGDPDGAIQLADGIEDAFQRLRVLAGSARVLCGRTGAADAVRGRDIAEQVATAANADAGVLPYQRSGAVALAGGAVALCEGPDAALMFLQGALTPDHLHSTLSRIVDDLTNEQEFVSARALAFADLGDADSLLVAARQLAKQGDKDAARTVALQASRVALMATRDTMPPPRWKDHLVLLSGIFASLAELGAYDEAIATVQLQDELYRRQYYFNVISAAIRNGDAAAVVRMVPAVVAAVKMPLPDWGSVQQLQRLIRILVDAGYRDAARMPYEEFKLLFGELTKPGGLRPDLMMLAELQALMDDLPTALATADRAGSLTAKRNGFAALMGVAMAAADANQALTREQLMAEAQRLAQSLPPLVPGPKAGVLRAITLALAEAGDVAGALQAEAGLEAEPRDALQGPRDEALAAIAGALATSGDLRPSFATAMRIAEPQSRAKSLLRLAAVPPHQ